MFILYNGHNPTKKEAIEEAFLYSLGISKPKIEGFDLPRHWSELTFSSDLDMLKHSQKGSGELLKNPLLKEIPNYSIFINEGIIKANFQDSGGEKKSFWGVTVSIINVYYNQSVDLIGPKIQLPNDFVNLFDEVKNIGKALDIYFSGDNIKFQKGVWGALTDGAYMRKEVLSNTIGMALSTTRVYLG